MAKGAAIIRVTMDVDYYIPLAKSNDPIGSSVTEVNGWSLDYVAHDWFSNFPIDRSHAARDSHRVGNGTRVLDTQIIPAGVCKTASNYDTIMAERQVLLDFARVMRGIGAAEPWMSEDEKELAAKAYAILDKTC